MTDIRDILIKRRLAIYKDDPEMLKKAVDSFMEMTQQPGVIICEFDGTYLVMQPIHEGGIYYCWLLFDKFKKTTVTCIKNAISNFKGFAMIAETTDDRMSDILQKIGFVYDNFCNKNHVLVMRGK